MKEKNIKEKNALWIVFGLTLVGALLRFWRLGHQSFWYDEAVTAEIVRHPLRDILVGQAKDLGNPPLHNILLFIWAHLFGFGDVSLRSLSALTSVVSIPVLYVLARRLAGVAPGLTAAAILAFSPFHIYYAQETRTYALVTLLCLLSIDMFLRCLERPGSPWLWVGYTLATFGAIYAHYFAFFVLLAENLIVYWKHRSHRLLVVRWLGAHVVMGLLYLTWLPAWIDQITTKGNLGRATETWYLHILATPLVYSVGRTLIWKDSVTPQNLLYAGLALVAFGVPFLAGVWAMRQKKDNQYLLLLWLALPVLLPLLISLFLFPFYFVMYSIMASPAWYLFIAEGLKSLRPSIRNACLLVMMLTGFLSLHRYYTKTLKHDWRGAAYYVEAAAQPQDLLLFDADINETSYAHYARKANSRIRLLPPPKASPEGIYGVFHRGTLPQDIAAMVSARPRIWLILSDNQSSGAGDYYDRLFERRWHRLRQKEFRGIEVRLYTRSKRS